MTLPTGTVTFLFTDIEGSTRLMRELGDRHHEDHVEEELEPRCVAPLRFAGSGAKAGRPKPYAEAWASSFLGPCRAPNFDPHRRIR